MSLTCLCAGKNQRRIDLKLFCFFVPKLILCVITIRHTDIGATKFDKTASSKIRLCLNVIVKLEKELTEYYTFVLYNNIIMYSYRIIYLLIIMIYPPTLLIAKDNWTIGMTSNQNIKCFVAMLRWLINILALSIF